MSPRVVLVAHGLPAESSGGAESHVLELALALARRGADPVLVAVENDPSRGEATVRADRVADLPVRWVNRTYRDVRSFRELYRSRLLRDRVGDLLDGLRPDVVHVHHLTGLSTDVLTDLALARTPTVVTLHDYWLLCQRGQLVDRAGRRCRGPHHGCRGCAEAASGVGSGALALAPVLRRLEGGVPTRLRRPLRRLLPLLPRRPGAVADAAAERLEHVRSLFRLPLRFHAPSRTLERVFLEAGLPADRFVTVRQGIDLDRFRDLPRREGASGRLRVGFLGSLTRAKGIDVLLDAFDRLGSDRRRVTLEIRGATADYHGDPRHRLALERRLAAAPRVSWPGRLGRDDVPGFLAGLDVLVVPSIWLENAPFVVAEAFAAGVPVVASDLGGMAESVRDGVDGLLFAPGDAGALAGVLRRLLDDPELLDGLRAGVETPHSIDDEAAEWLRTYAAERAVQRPARARLDAVVLDHETPGDTVLAVRSLRSSRRPPDRVLVVENGSSKAAVARVRRELPGVEVLELEENRGFSGGANAGIRAALDDGAERVLLLNADVIVFPETVGRLEAGLDARTGCGPVGPVLLAGDDPGRIASAGIGYRSLTGRMRHREAGVPWDPETPAGVGEVPALAGCALLFDRETLESVGLFEESWWFSFEDLELCLRARRAGRAPALVRAARALHLGSRSIGPANPRRLYFAARNHLRLAREVRPLPPPLGAARELLVLALTAAHASTGGYPRREGLAAVRRGFRDYRRGRTGPGVPEDAEPGG